MPYQGRFKQQAVGKKTDRAIQAEIKNKIEILRCQHYTKVLDREKLHQEFSINREQRLVMKAMEKMETHTSGILIS